MMADAVRCSHRITVWGETSTMLTTPKSRAATFDTERLIPIENMDLRLSRPALPSFSFPRFRMAKDSDFSCLSCSSFFVAKARLFLTTLFFFFKSLRRAAILQSRLASIVLVFMSSLAKSDFSSCSNFWNFSRSFESFPCKTTRQVELRLFEILLTGAGSLRSNNGSGCVCSLGSCLANSASSSEAISIGWMGRPCAETGTICKQPSSTVLEWAGIASSTVMGGSVKSKPKDETSAAFKARTFTNCSYAPLQGATCSSCG